MQKLTFVIGATAVGKSYFIEKNYGGKNVEILDVFDYQQRAYDEAGYTGNSVPFGADFACLKKANDMLLEDIIEKLRLGRDVVTVFMTVAAVCKKPSLPSPTVTRPKDY